ncbi:MULTISPECIES: GTP-binding protein EngB [unclassified Methanosarcina]|jgi:GTP-binding protein EngB required for normal cell division|uniref:GTP-binding protein EngB n=1 Tax=unclassified Methanosarcina TaxID=2644672 RepID=UPI0006225155|nr:MULTISPECIES: GTP-binding protein EngB [unclassified Methanosarcina]KKG10721.1 GTP-binding protein [Methanosarcina sp. 2.H.A.1B.4]KKH49733.1 GTP-binding protein [Methanosarcina sp. 1.H.A.2.2]
METSKTAAEHGVNIEIIFVGRSNVGKSSLLREIFGAKVRVGRRPGVTLRPIHAQASDLLITDMPGFGFMSGVKDRKQDIVKDQTVRYIEKNAERIKLGVLVIDGPAFPEVVDRWDSRNQIPIDVEMFDFMRELGIDTIVATNKMDKVKADEYDYLLDEVSVRLGLEPPWQNWKHIIAPISAKKGDLKALKGLLRDRLHEMKRDDLFKYV